MIQADTWPPMPRRILRPRVARLVGRFVTVTSGLLLGVSCSMVHGQGRLISPSPADADKVVGHISWVITDKTKAVLGQGTSDVRVRDIRVTDESRSESEPRYSKTIRLNDEFSLTMAEYPEQTKHRSEGFGMMAQRAGGRTFSWEWFVIDNEEHATKLQESGELRIRATNVGQGQEIVYTEFLSDVSFRILAGVDDPVTTPKWRVKVAKGSKILWPSVANGKLVLK